MNLVLAHHDLVQLARNLLGTRFLDQLVDLLDQSVGNPANSLVNLLFGVELVEVLEYQGVVSDHGDELLDQREAFRVPHIGTELPQNGVFLLIGHLPHLRLSSDLVNLH